MQLKPMIGALFFTLLVLPGALGSVEETRFLSFSVKERHDIFVRDLKRQELELYIDEKPVEIRYLGGRNVETAFVMLLENSPRTAQHAVSNPHFGQVNTIDRIRWEMMDDFFLPLTRQGPVLMGQFFEKLEILQDFTEEEYELMNALQRIEPNFARIMHNQIEIGRILGRAYELLQARSERRKLIVLFTTTIDRESYKHLDEYRSLFREANIEVFIVSFSPRTVSGPGWTFEEKMNPYFFKKLAGATSGKLYLTGDYTYLEELFTDLKGRLRNHYTIGFKVSPGAVPKEHSVELRVNRPETEVSCRDTIIF